MKSCRYLENSTVSEFDLLDVIVLIQIDCKLEIYQSY